MDPYSLSPFLVITKFVTQKCYYTILITLTWTYERWGLKDGEGMLRIETSGDD
jgi:hypothetical protein